MMASSTLENRLKVHHLVWLGVALVGVTMLGFYLAYDKFTAVFASLALIWLITLPYHSLLAIYVSVATFGSALILPFFPGRPYMWEFAALLGWSGLMVTISMRRFREDYMDDIHDHRWLFIGIIGYCLVLVSIMAYRGVGLRIFGSGQMGGRFYFQQLVCAIFPLMFIMIRPSEKILVRLFVLQCLLSFTFFISDFAYSIAPKGLFFLLQFFELPGDAANFELQAERFGIRRFQSLREVSQGILFFLLVMYPAREFLGRKSIFLVPLSILIFVFGLLSGHRILVLVVIVVAFFCAYAQRFFNSKHIAIGFAVGSLALLITYSFADYLPLAGQRAISFLPGINIDRQAVDDGYGTIVTRQVLRKIGMEMAPQYFWMGRGFGITMNEDYSLRWDPTMITMHVSQGRFFNGFIGLLVNTGIFGTVFMFILLAAGTSLAWQVIHCLRRLGSNDTFLRMCGVLAGLWMVSEISFIFLHGDSEYALKTFSLQAGMLLVCHRHLKERIARLPVPVPTRRYY